jgi:hypothetical protein
MRHDASTLVVRALAVFLILIAATQLTTWWVVRSLSHDFETRAKRHLGTDVQHVREQVKAIESSLDGSADRLKTVLSAQRIDDRAALFAILRDEVHSRRGRGARIVTATGEPIAWWGEDLPFKAHRRYQFDVTNLYITSVRELPSLRVETFVRISNGGESMERFHASDTWIVSMTFHGGFLRQEPSTRRYLIDRQAESSLWLDVVTRGRSEVIDATQNAGRTVTALLVALACLVALALGRGRMPLLGVIALIVVARLALIAVSVREDPLNIFGFEVYGSRILGPLSRSPVDLLLTAAAILAIVIVTARKASKRAVAARVAVALAAGFGFVLIAQNLVDNSRISAIPEHIVPVSAAQGVLLSALLFFAFAVLRMTWHAASRSTAVIAAGVAVIPILLIASAMSPASGGAFVVVAASVLLATLFSAVSSNRSARLAAMALLTVPLVFAPLQIFERGAARRFIADSYAPLVVGEAGQLRTMIEDTLRNEFSRTDLSTILPDDYRHMNLDDLAYALWLRSDLSKLRVPAVITIHDEFTRTTISRFGVGLPQFDERSPTVGREILQVGSLRRDLIHHDFQMTALGTTIAEGSVHVVNPADPGATAFADIYRDFFQSAPDSAVEIHRQIEPAVYDRDGNAESPVNVRLPQNPSWYIARLRPGSGAWVQSSTESSEIYLRRTDNALYAFPLQTPTLQQQVRRAGGVAIWALLAVLLVSAWWSMPAFVAFIRSIPRRFT